MNGAKKIFIQSMTISTGILFLNGVLAVVRYFSGSGGDLTIKWYHPITIILIGVLCALPTLLLRNSDQWDRKTFFKRVALHALMLYAVILGMGRLLKWYTDAAGCVGVSAVFFPVYAFVWLSGHWLDKQDEKKINQALEGIRDRE